MWPWQALQVLVHLVPQPVKPKDRAIGCLAMLVKLHGKLKKTYPDKWSDERAGFWDEAVRGSSAFQAALKRALTDEAACLLGATAGCLYVDIASFYDNVDLEFLFGRSLDMGFPRKVLILSFLAHISPKWLTQGGGSQRHLCTPSSRWSLERKTATTWRGPPSTTSWGTTMGASG